MRKIYILDENNQPKLIDAGITQYAELSDAPIITTYKNVPLYGSRIFIDETNGELDIEADGDHKWTEDEVLLWCQSAPQGRYDIISDAEGVELLLIDDSDETRGKRFRRITVTKDMVYKADGNNWVPISDLSADKLIFNIKNEKELTTTVYAVGSKIELQCYYYSTVADGTITVKKNGRTVVAATLPRSKTTSIDLTSAMSDGDNVFNYTVTNNAPANSPVRDERINDITIRGMQLGYSPTFSEMSKQSGDITFRFSHSGTLPEGDAKYAYITTYDASGNSHSAVSEPITIPRGSTNVVLPSSYFSHGVNKITTYLGAVREGEDTPYVKTDILSYTFPYVVTEDPIVMTYFDFSSIQEWATIKIPYIIWKKSANITDAIRLELKYTQDNGKTYKTITQEYNSLVIQNQGSYLTANASHTWQLSNTPHGILEFNIYLGQFERAENGEVVKENDKPVYANWNLAYRESGIIVKKSSYSFDAVAGYLFNFAANDIQGTSAFDTWTSKGHTLKLSGLNWTTDGIKTEENRSIKLTTPGRIVMDNAVSLFEECGGGVDENGYSIPGSGASWEVDFKVNASADNTKPIIRFGSWDYEKNKWRNDRGVLIYPNKAVFNYKSVGTAGEEDMAINFQKGERINFGITVEPLFNAGKGNNFIKLYLNGIVSQVLEIEDSSVQWASLNRVEFNCEGNEFDFYGFRAYEETLASQDMLQNYISNFADATLKTNMLGNNNIYGTDPKPVITNSGQELKENQVLLSETIGKIGCLVVVMPVLPTAKKPYLKCHTIYYEKDPNNPEIETASDGRSMATTYYFKEDGSLNKEIKVAGQGTSSMEYPRKNLKFKFKDKFYIKGHKAGKDKTITCKADYMDSSGANNICNAQITDNAIRRDLWKVRNDETGSKTPANLGARVNLDGFPVCIFHATGVDGDSNPYYENADGSIVEPLYTGIYNFNYDKKPKALLGWEEYKNPNYKQDVITNKQNEQEQVKTLQSEYKTLLEKSNPTTEETIRMQEIESTLGNIHAIMRGKTGEELLQSIETYFILSNNFINNNKEVIEFDFQGFEFRDNTSSMCLQTGIPNFLEFVNPDRGYEWRWTTLSDWIDDFHSSKNLGLLWDGAYCAEESVSGEKVDEYIFEYTEEQYIQHRLEKEVSAVPAFNRLYIENDHGKNQLYRKAGEHYLPVNYSDIGLGGDAWGQDYGLKFATDTNGNSGLYWQKPYGATLNTKDGGLTGGQLYESGEGYYKYRHNPDHKAMFEYNDTEEYFNNLDNWTKLYDLSDLYARKVTYTPSDDGDFVLDPVDDLYHPYRYYTFYRKDGDNYVQDDQGTYIRSKLKDGKYSYKEIKERFNQTIEYLPFNVNDKLVIEDLMKEIFAHWYYCIDTLCHIKRQDLGNGKIDYKLYKNLIDSNQTYNSELAMVPEQNDGLGDNGYGLFILDALLNYYASSVTVGLCDNFCKNMMIHSYDGGKTWSPAWYDMDTCFGLNNVGAYVFDYDVDFNDPGVFNGSNSTLWNGLYNNYMPEISDMYRELRDRQMLDYDNSMKIIYDGNIKYKSEAMYNSSAVDRYILPTINDEDGVRLRAAQGNRLSLLRYWLSNRQTFLDSRYGSESYSSDFGSIRMWGPREFTLNLVPDTTMYLGFAFNQADADMPAETSRSPKIKAGNTWSYTIPVAEGQALQDLNTKIFGISHLLEIGDLSGTVPDQALLGNATRLREIVFGTDDPELLDRYNEIGASRGFQLELPKTISPNLTKIDLHNLKYLNNSTLSTTVTENDVVSVLYPALKHIDVRGSNISKVNVGNYMPLEYLGCSDVMVDLSLKNLPELNTVDLKDISHITNVVLNNTPKLKQFDIVSKFLEQQIKLSVDNLNISENEAVTTDFMGWLVRINATITGGTIYVEGFDETIYKDYALKWPSVTFKLKKVYSKDVIFGVSGEGK